MLATIIWFVILGALAYILMRISSYRGHRRGTHTTGHDRHKVRTTIVRDPVCGPQGPAGQTVVTGERDGKA